MSACSEEQLAEPDGADASPYRTRLQVSYISRDLYTSNGTIHSDDKLIERLERQFNMDLNLMYISSPNQTEIFAKLNALIASGDIPDMMEARIDDLGGEVYRSLSREGQLIDVEQFLELHPGRYPYLAERIAHPDAAAYRAEDGRLYAIPRLFGEWDHAWYIRQDWLDKLGLPMPTTLDELYETLKVFVREDPDGKDTTGLTLSNVWWLNHIFAGFTGGFNWVERDGEYVYNYTLPEMKDAFLYINKLYEEGLLDREFFTHKPERDEIAKFASGRAGVLLVGATFMERVLPMLKRHNSEAEIAFLPATLSGPGGIAHISGAKMFEGVMIYQGTRDPERIFDFLEYSLSPEGRELYAYGVEGEHFTIDSEGNRQPREDIFAREGWHFGGRHPLLGSMLDASTLLTDEALKAFDEEYKTKIRTFFHDIEQVEGVARDRLPGVQIEALRKAGSRPSDLFYKYQAGFITGELDIESDWETFRSQYLAAGYADAAKEVNQR
ncbi:hypothetical protein PA598K_00702 [Paenibacillus sp. 598K]|nr:hypothetical protein PA598K_00702 [Paenibacillus sp. 598K]